MALRLCTFAFDIDCKRLQLSTYLTWAGEFTSVELANVRATKQEAGSPAPRGDAPPISNSSREQDCKLNKRK